MSDFDSLRAELEGTDLAPLLGLMAAMEVQQRTDATLGAWCKELSAEIVKLWEDAAERRDELHALSNRIETLTRAFMLDAAEVAQKIVNDSNRATLREVKRDDTA